MKLNKKVRNLLVINLIACSVLTGCSATNEIDLIDDQGNIIEKPEGYDDLPKGLEELKKEEVEAEKPKLELQDLEELRDKETGYVPLDKANEWIAAKMVGYREVDRKFDEEAGVTRIFYVNDGGAELEVRILHPYAEDGITVITDQVLQILLGERDLNTINEIDENAQH